MNISGPLKNMVSKSLGALGGDVTIKRFTEGVYDSESGTFFQNETTATIKGVISNVARNEVNDLIESQDKKVTISAGDLTFAPTTKDRVVISSVEFKIIQVITNEQNNTAVSFDLILR